jgi:hypothetical protein
MTTWTFRTPSGKEGPASWENRLFLRLKLSRGVSLLEGPPGTFRVARFPTQDEIAASAPRFYMGGHEYDVSDQDKADLIAAGVGVTDADFTDPATLHGFGSGLFGDGVWGG